MHVYILVNISYRKQPLLLARCGKTLHACLSTQMPICRRTLNDWRACAHTHTHRYTHKGTRAHTCKHKYTGTYRLCARTQRDSNNYLCY